MQHTTLNNHKIERGGRVASSLYRQSLKQQEDFTGLEADCSRYDLLLLCKRVGRHVGFSPRMIQLLDYYMAFTRDCDWEEGSSPIVYQSLSRTAQDMGVSERQIQHLEQRLFEVGAITWHDSGNHKRYGQRDAESGEILYAYGVDLTPLAFLKPELEDKLHEKQLYDQAWQETKREVSWCRSQIRGLLLEIQEEGAEPDAIQSLANSYHNIAIQIRTHISLIDLRSLLMQHQDLHAELLKFVEAERRSGDQAVETVDGCGEKHEKIHPEANNNFTHIKYKTHEINRYSSPPDRGLQKSVGQPTELNDSVLATGVQHVSPKLVLQAASDRFRQRLPLTSRPISWHDVVEAAHRLRSELHISQKSWAEACQVLGRYGAALCILITDCATQRPDDPVRLPAAYFRGMIKQGRIGELRLHSSIFALVERSLEGKAA